jgi:hypothetical protein
MASCEIVVPAIGATIYHRVGGPYAIERHIAGWSRPPYEGRWTQKKRRGVLGHRAVVAML